MMKQLDVVPSLSVAFPAAGKSCFANDFVPSDAGPKNSVKVLCMLLCATQYHNKLLPLVTLSWLWRLYVFPPLQRVLWVKEPLISS